MRRWLLSTISIGTVALLILLLLPFSPIGWGVPYHSTCQEGSVVQRSELLTPWLILASPYLNNATGFATPLDNSQIRNAPPPGNESNGGVLGQFSLNNWTQVSVTTVWVAGPGTNLPCTSLFIAQLDPTPIPILVGGSESDFISLHLLGAGNSTDRYLPVQVSYQGFRSVVFGVPFVDNYGYFGNCGDPTVQYEERLNTTNPLVAVPFVGPTGGINITAALPISTHYRYEYGGGAGTWFRMLGPFGAFTFEWQRC